MCSSFLRLAEAAAQSFLEMASHLQSQAARLRQVVLPYLERLQGAIDETVNRTVRTGDTARFIISLEGGHVLRVGSREGMVFPAHQTSGGVVLLADLSEDKLNALYAEERCVDCWKHVPR